MGIHIFVFIMSRFRVIIFNVQHDGMHERFYIYERTISRLELQCVLNKVNRALCHLCGHTG